MKKIFEDVRVSDEMIINIGIVPYSNKYATKHSDALNLISINDGRKELRFDLYLSKQSHKPAL